MAYLVAGKTHESKELIAVTSLF